MSLLFVSYYVFGNNNSGGLFSFYLFISFFFLAALPGRLPPVFMGSGTGPVRKGCWESVVCFQHLNERLPETPSPSHLFVFRV